MTRGPIGMLLGVAVASCILAGAVGAQSSGSDPFIGTWKLNVERSVYMPGPRPPADLVTLYQFSTLEGGWNRFMLTSVNAQGEPTLQILTFKVDGQRYPVHDQNTLGRFMATGQQTNLTRSYRRIDASTVEFTSFTDGVAGIPQVRSVAPDGRSYTDTARGTNAQGVAVSNVTVWDRVR